MNFTINIPGIPQFPFLGIPTINRMKQGIPQFAPKPFILNFPTKWQNRQATLPS